MSDGSSDEIEHLPFNKAIKTLDLMTCSSRSNETALDRMQQQGQEWVDKVLASTLSRQNIWSILATYRIWNFATWNELESCLKRVYSGSLLEGEEYEDWHQLHCNN